MVSVLNGGTSCELALKGLSEGVTNRFGNADVSNELEADTTSTMSQRDEISTLGKDFFAFWDSWNALPRTGSIPRRM